VNRSSAGVYSTVGEGKSLDWSPGDAPLRTQLILRRFSVSLSLPVRDGQAVQNTVATDPVSGRPLKAELTAWAVE
jgi:hypothetical protein